MCRQCPVIDACLGWALETRQDTGVWGGRSESERRKLRRRVARTRRVAGAGDDGRGRRGQVRSGAPLPLHSSQGC
ncbi:WhiB family transcriptional regulator [Georgenia satyanarayanai]|uniref:WhiB family transcriptional regulator n=1 Tax=Georgenia satyanarayanai TaxID=860221 RepID=UPI0035A0CF09